MSNRPWEKFEKKDEPKPAQEELATPSIVKSAAQTSSPSTPSPTTIVLSQDDAYIHEVSKSQPRTLDEIEAKVMDREDPSQHRLSLPPEFKEYEERFTFRWIFKRRQAISEATQVKGWVLVNKTYFPDLPNHLFTANGAVERGDNILAFMSRKLAEGLRKKANDLSTMMVKSRLGAHKGNPNFYTPADGESAEDGRVIGI